MRLNSWGSSERPLAYQHGAMVTIVVLGLALIAAQSGPAPTSPPGQTQSQTSALSGQSGQPLAAPAKPLIMIDAAHGGSESGAVLNPTILEKDVTLALARRLRGDLGARGFVAELVRDSDINLSTDDRAAKVNAAHPALYLCLHASSEPGKIGIYTAMLAEDGETNGPFVDWNTAQFSFLPASRTAQQHIAAAMQQSGIATRSLAAPLRPLRNLLNAAIAVELAPSKADVSQLSAEDFQQSISTPLANGITQFLSDAGKVSGAPQ